MRRHDDGAHLAELARQYPTYARNHGDNQLYRVAAGASDRDLVWTETLMTVRRIESFLEGHSAVMNAYDPCRKVGLVLDEWGTWWNPTDGTDPGFLEQQNALRDALVRAVTSTPSTVTPAGS